MREISAVFLDDGGVMNDNAIRSAEWQRLVGEFFVPVLGGDHEGWAAANRVVFEHLLDFLTLGPLGRDYTQWWDEYQSLWLRDMAAFIGVATPGDDMECTRLAEEAALYITQRVRSAYPGVVDTVRIIQEMGKDLFTASGEVSHELDGYLTGMGIRGCFQTLYGPDLINQAKDGPEYYDRLFKHANVDPKSALVVDDNFHAVDWAHSVGAMTCLITVSAPGNIQADITVQSLADLPVTLKEYESNQVAQEDRVNGYPRRLLRHRRNAYR